MPQPFMRMAMVIFVCFVAFCSAAMEMLKTDDCGEAVPLPPEILVRFAYGDDPLGLLKSFKRLSSVNKRYQEIFTDAEFINRLFILFSQNLTTKIPLKLGQNLLHLLAQKQQYPLINDIFAYWQTKKVLIDVNAEDNWRINVFMSIWFTKPKEFSETLQQSFDNVCRYCIRASGKKGSPVTYFGEDHAGNRLKATAGDSDEEMLKTLATDRACNHPLPWLHVLVITEDINQLREAITNPTLSGLFHCQLYARENGCNYENPLEIACRIGNSQIFRVLLESFDRSLNQALNTALMHGHLELAEELLKAKPDAIDWNQPLLIPVASHGNLQGLRFLLHGNAFVDARDSNNQTALICAAKAGQPESLKALLKAGACVDARDKNGKTALIHAASAGQLESLNVLLEATACVDAIDKDGKTALMHAAHAGHLEIAKRLLAYGANPNAKTTEPGYTALIFAAYQGHLSVASELLNRGALIDERDNLGRTALMHAAGSNSERLAMVKFLIDWGADASACGQHKETAHTYAKKHHYVQVIKVLLGPRAG